MIQKITVQNVYAIVRCTATGHETEVCIDEVTASHGETIEGFIYSELESRGWDVNYDHNAEVTSCKCPAAIANHDAFDCSED